jgi:hypothetical protein
VITCGGGLHPIACCRRCRKGGKRVPGRHRMPTPADRVCQQLDAAKQALVSWRHLRVPFALLLPRGSISVDFTRCRVCRPARALIDLSRVRLCGKGVPSELLICCTGLIPVPGGRLPSAKLLETTELGCRAFLPLLSVGSRPSMGSTFATPLIQSSQTSALAS